MDHDSHIPTLLLVPIEIRRKILKCLPDLKSLFNCVVSCRAWYYAYTAADKSIVVNTLIVRKQALAVPLFQAKKLPGIERKEGGRDIIAQYLDNFERHRLSKKNSWKRAPKSDDDEILEDYRMIRQFARKLCKAELSHKDSEEISIKKKSKTYLDSDREEGKEVEADAPPSDRELYRVECALYAFGIAQALFQFTTKPSGFNLETASIRFFHALGVWESRAVNSVLNFMRNRIRTISAFDEFKICTGGMLLCTPLPDLYKWFFEMDWNEQSDYMDEIGWPSSTFAENIEEYERTAALNLREYMEENGFTYKESQVRPVCKKDTICEVPQLQESGLNHEMWAYVFDVDFLDEEDVDDGTYEDQLDRDAGIWDIGRLEAMGYHYPEITGKLED